MERKIQERKRKCLHLEWHPPERLSSRSCRCVQQHRVTAESVGSTLFGRRMLLHYIEGDRRVRNRGSSPHLGRYPNGFHDLLFGRPLLTGVSGMCRNAIRALCYMSNRDCDEIVCFSGECSLGKHLPAEGAPGIQRFRSQFFALFSDFRCCSSIKCLLHSASPRIKACCRSQIELGLSCHQSSAFSRSQSWLELMGRRRTMLMHIVHPTAFARRKTDLCLREFSQPTTS